MILFGIRSPLVVEYEETCHRLGLEITSAVSVNGTPRTVGRKNIVKLEDFDPPEGAQFLACAFEPSRRAELIEQARSLGLTLAPALVDPSAVLARSVRLGEGAFVNSTAVIGAVSFIGEGVLVNRAVSLGHHCMLGNYVSVGPGATLAGNIQVGNNSMIGAGTTILPDIRIGESAIIAAGSLVRKHVPDGAFVAGNPAQEKTFKKAGSSLHIDNAE